MIQHGSRLDLFLTRAAHLLVLLLGAWLLCLGVFNLRARSDWALGDWLINYSGGFVRRGLVGEGALQLRHLGLSPFWSVLVLQWLLYAVILLAIWRLLNAMRWNVWLAALVFSPATLAFCFFDPPFAFRKEILFLALLSGTLWLLTKQRDPQAAMLRLDVFLSLELSLGCAVCVLSHEGLIVFFPYLFGAAWVGTGSLRRAARCFAVPAAISVFLFVLVSHFPGNAAVAETVCRSIGGTLTEPPYGLCGGAIDYLRRDAAFAHAQVIQVAAADHYARRMPWLFVLAMLPAVLGVATLKPELRAARLALGACTTLATVLSISLFVYGTDWTRWIYVHAMSLLLLLLFLANQQAVRKIEPAQALSSLQPGRRACALVLIVVYALGWELTPYGQPRPLGGFVHYLRHELPQTASAHMENHKQ